MKFTSTVEEADTMFGVYLKFVVDQARISSGPQAASLLFGALLDTQTANQNELLEPTVKEATVLGESVTRKLDILIRKLNVFQSEVAQLKKTAMLEY